ANESRRKKAEEGLKKILGRDSEEAMSDLEVAQTKLDAQKKKQAQITGEEDEAPAAAESEDASEEQSKKTETKKTKK
ncbi:MAG: DNA topoisomerase VI subunit B, partial [Pseudobdellovibrio sp.]